MSAFHMRLWFLSRLPSPLCLAWMAVWTKLLLWSLCFNLTPYRTQSNCLKTQYDLAMCLPNKLQSFLIGLRSKNSPGPSNFPSLPHTFCWSIPKHLPLQSFFSSSNTSYLLLPQGLCTYFPSWLLVLPLTILWLTSAQLSGLSLNITSPEKPSLNSLWTSGFLGITSVGFSSFISLHLSQLVMIY